MANAMHIKPVYRADIDGLRAVAVMLVVINHVFPRHIRGGYVGVDVFFVISGYLIGGSMLSELRGGQFSVAGFYERRIRRILPALFVMMFATAALAYVYFLPSQVYALGGSFLAALFSVSNVLFLLQAGYFDTASVSKPLLHTWSLGVEEQFYVFFPLLLMAIFRWFPLRLKASIWTVTICSLIISTVCVEMNAASSAFFLAPLRAWEMMLGVIASQSTISLIQTSGRRNATATVGMLLILAPAIEYSSSTPFPGLSALLPCIGSVLLILAGVRGSNIVGRILSWRPILFLGKISYSLYLWHWLVKVFVYESFAFYGLTPQLRDRVDKIFIMSASFVIATLSWRFVEWPIRKGRLRPTRRHLFAGTAVAVVGLAVIGCSMLLTKGRLRTFSQPVLSADASLFTDPALGWRKDQCFLTTSNGIEDKSAFRYFDKTLCLHQDSGRKNYLLYGDSHAADKYAGLVSVFPELNFMQATVSGCQPLLHEPVDVRENCRELSSFMFNEYLPSHHIDGIILAGAWEDDELPELQQTLAWMHEHGIEIILIGPSIQFDGILPQLIAVSLRDSRPPSFLRDLRQKDPEVLDGRMASLARSQWKVRYISMYENLCKPSTQMETKSAGESQSECPIYSAPGVPLLRDKGHLSLSGSLLFAQIVRAKSELS